MNKLTIPSILAATVLIAGIFALMPVEKASTVHTGIQNTLTTELTKVQNNIKDLENKITVLEVEQETDSDLDSGDKFTLDCTEEFAVISIFAGLTGDAGTSTSLAVSIGGVDIGMPVDLETNGFKELVEEVRRPEPGRAFIAVADEDVVLTAAEADADDGNDEEVTVTAQVLVSKGGSCTFENIAALAAPNG